MKRRLLFRADGSPKIGFGHIYRVLALVEMLKNKNDCFLVTSLTNEFIAAEVSRLGISLIQVNAFEYPFPNERKETDEIPFDMGDILEKNDVVVTDGYWFGNNYQQAIRMKGCALICIDDLATGEFSADVVINHAPGIDRREYKLADHTTLYLGLDYLILRPAFFEARQPRQKLKKKIYLSFGGSDYYGLSLKFLKLCLALPDQISLCLLLSSSFDKDLISKISSLQKAHTTRVSLFQNLDGQEISNLIDTCTHAITASSTVALEVVARGVRPLIGHYSDNQKKIYNGLIAERMAFGAGDIQNESHVNLYDYVNVDATLEREFNYDKILAIFESFS